MVVAMKRAPAKDDLRVERELLRQAQAQALFDEIVSAGCGFRIEFEELRLTNMSAMSADQWARFNVLGGTDEFIALARQHAETNHDGV